MMRKPTWWDLGIAAVGLVLVCGAAQGVSQVQSQYPEGSVGDVTQDTRITGTSDGLGSDQGLTTGGTTAQTGTGGSGMDMGQGTGGSGTGDTGQDTGTGPQQLSALETQQRVEIARLRAQVAGLEHQLARTRVQLARTQAAQGTGTGTGGSGQDMGTGTGTGGSGTGSSAIGDPNAEAPTGAMGIGYATAEGVGGGGTAGRADTDTEGVAVAHVIHRGRVRSVTQQQLVLDEEDGGSSTLPLARDVRVTQGRQQMALRNLSEGSLVRTSADLYARGNPVTSIEVLSSPKSPAKK
ncbi:MAG TPA: hypothetical protein VEU33_34575 [Archangium sp.]|nr:hypothetical protein [Archangium sp.]